MYTIKNEYLDITFKADSCNFEITSLKFKNNEVCYQQNSSWKKTWPLLFPNCGAINGYIKYNGVKYPLPRHGFMKNINNWTIKSIYNDCAVLSFSSNCQFSKIYPFEFELDLILKVAKNVFSIDFVVTNVEDVDMYYSFGHHPAFKVDDSSKIVLESEETFFDSFTPEGLYLEYEQNKKKWKEIIIKDVDFSESKSYFCDTLRSGYLLYKNDSFEFKLPLNDYSTLGLWRDNNDSGFICIEPWCGMPDKSGNSDHNLKNKYKILKLNPKESKKISFQMIFNTN